MQHTINDYDDSLGAMFKDMAASLRQVATLRGLIEMILFLALMITTYFITLVMGALVGAV